MKKFNPVGGELNLEYFDNPNVVSAPILTIALKIDFAEPMDPDDPKGNLRSSAEIDGIPFAFEDWWKCVGQTLRVAEIDQHELTEGAIYYRGYHNPVDVEWIHFELVNDTSIKVQLKGTIDFTYEGLTELGKPDFDWTVELAFDPNGFQRG